jgi:hypothetical protein
VAAARAAVGLARAESPRRRVAVGDLVGDVPPLVALGNADDAHGIVDSFLYGVSLNKVARPVAGADNLFVLPSGTEPVVTAEIYRSDRWRRLASGFREMGALLLLVAPSDAVGLESLVEMLDGVVTVGDDDGALARRFTVLASVGTPVATAADDDVAAANTGDLREPGTPGRRREPRTGRGRAPLVLPPAAPARSRRVLVPALLLLAIAGGGGAWWMQQQRGLGDAPAGVARDTARTTADGAVDPARDTLPMAPLVPMNPADSAGASAWALEVAKFNTEDGARAGLAQAATLPGATWFRLWLSNDAGTWYRVVGGGWTTRESADSALAALTGAGALPTTASVLRAPLALLVGSGMPADSVRARSARYLQAGVPVYALRQADGTHHLYAGAFETPDQSMFLALALQQLGDVPTLVYRTGRAP